MAKNPNHPANKKTDTSTSGASSAPDTPAPAAQRNPLPQTQAAERFRALADKVRNEREAQRRGLFDAAYDKLLEDMAENAKAGMLEACLTATMLATFIDAAGGRKNEAGLGLDDEAIGRELFQRFVADGFFVKSDPAGVPNSFVVSWAPQPARKKVGRPKKDAPPGAGSGTDHDDKPATAGKVTWNGTEPAVPEA